MARYGSEHKQATRRRIIEVAGRRLKLDGIDGSGVATLMKDAGLTNGAFYSHFASKDDLVATTIADQLSSQRAELQSATIDGVGIERFVRNYLSVEHRDNPGEGCPSAALLDEVGRSSEDTRTAYTEGIMAIVDHMSAILEPDDLPAVRLQTLGGIASMIGTMQMARAITDHHLADSLLEQGIENTLALLGVD